MPLNKKKYIYNKNWCWVILLTLYVHVVLYNHLFKETESDVFPALVFNMKAK